MPTITLNPAGGAMSPCDGLIWSDAIQTWQQSHDNIAGSYATSTDNPGNIVAGYSNNGENEILRSIFSFDKSTLPLNTVITSAKLSLYIYSDSNYTYGFNTVPGINAFMRVVQTSPASTSDVALTDYPNFGISALSDDLTFTGLTLDAYNDFTLNSTALSYLSSNNTVSLGIRDGYDLNNSAYPNGANFQVWGNHAGAQTVTSPYVPNMYPILAITYSSPSSLSSLSSSRGTPTNRGDQTNRGTSLNRGLASGRSLL